VGAPNRNAKEINPPALLLRQANWHHLSSTPPPVEQKIESSASILRARPALSGRPRVCVQFELRLFNTAPVCIM